MQHAATDSGQSAGAARTPVANVGEVERAFSALTGLAVLGYAWKRRSPAMALVSTSLLLRGVSGYCPAYAALGVNHGVAPRQALSGSRGIHVHEAIIIDAPPETIYRFWRRLDGLPRVMPHLEKVEQLDGKRSKWTAKAFDTVPISWEAEIINEVPFQTIAWQTLPGQAIQNAGSVTFKPSAGQRGTEVRVHLQYAPPGGQAAAWFASLVGQDPSKMTREGLHALKHELDNQPNR